MFFLQRDMSARKREKSQKFKMKLLNVRQTQNSKEIEPLDSPVKENWEIDHIHALNAEVKELQHLVEKTTFGWLTFIF